MTIKGLLFCSFFITSIFFSLLNNRRPGDFYFVKQSEVVCVVVFILMLCANSMMWELTGGEGSSAANFCSSYGSSVGEMSVFLAVVVVLHPVVRNHKHPVRRLVLV